MTNIQAVSTPAYTKELSLSQTSTLEDQLAQAPATHAYYVDGQAKSMLVSPSKLALKLADGVTSDDLSSLGIEFDRKLTDDFSVYKTVNQSAINREQLTESGLIEDAVSVFFVQGSRSEAVVLDEVIVSLKSGVTEAEYFAGNELFSSHRRVDGTPNQFVARVADGTGEVALHVANSIDEDTRLEFTAPNFYQSWQKYFTPNDPRFADQWYLNNTGQGGGLVDADPDVAEAWDVTKGSSTVIVGVLDDGISSHADQLASQLWRNPGEIPDGIDNDNNGWLDENNGWNFAGNNAQSNQTGANDRHGTAIAGIIGARGENALGVAGVAYQSRVMSAKMAENATATNDANIASAFYYAAGRTADGLGTWKASDVIVWAWGGGSGAAVINTAMTWATTNGNLGKGVPIFVGTGNGNGVVTAVTEPALQSLTNPGVIAVGAYNNKGLRSDYSNFGPALDLMAPSNDGRAGYLAIDTTDRLGTDGYNGNASPTGDYTGTANLAGWGAGTSTAAAVAAGIGALTLTRSIALGITPAITAAQLKSYLRANTDYIGGQFAPYDIATGKADEYGYGSINANSAVSNLNKPEISVLTTTSELQSGNTVVVGKAQFGANVDRVIRIRNQGTQTLNLTSLSLPSGPFSIVSAPGSTALALGESTTFTVRYSPTGGGEQTRVLTINSNDANEAAFAITLSGTGPNATGRVFEDYDGDSNFDAPDVLKSNHVVFLDSNNNGVRDSAVTTFSNATSTPIPDVTTITSTIAVSGLTSVVRDVDVRVNITHPFVSDLMITLISPSGTRVMLANRNGGGGDNFTNTVFDDEAATLISAGTAAFTGSFRPLQSLGALDGFNGNGTWTLEVAEQYAADFGTLVSWDVLIGTAEQVVNTAADGSYGLFELPIGLNVLRHEVPVGWSLANNISHTIGIATPNDNVQERNFGIGKNDRFYAAVFDDYNVNGLWDLTEVAVSGRVIVDDLNSNGINDGGGETNLNMGANGYGFLDLPAGPHNILLDTFPGWRYTLPSNGIRTVTVAGAPMFDQRFGTRLNNQAPIDVAVVPNSVPENSASGTVLGSFNTNDPDFGDTFTYTLVPGSGDTDNALFTINGSGGLVTAASFNFEVTPSFSVRVRTTDQDGLFFEKNLTVTVTNVNETPTDVALSANTITENLATGTTVGSFSSTDVDVGDTFTYTLVSGAGSTDNAQFTIDGAGNLKTAAPFNFEATPSFSARVRTTDAGGLFFEKTFTITVNDINEAPTDIALSANTIAENAVSGTTIGSFGSTDEDAANTFSYTLVAGTGSTDNAQFTIDGSGTLKSAAPFDFEATPTLSVRVRSTDQGGLFFEKIFTINLTNVNETPTDIAISANTIEENSASGTSVGSFSSTDPDAANTFTYTLVSGAGSTDNALFTIDGSGTLQTAAAFNFETTPSFSVRVRTTDQGGLFFEKAFTINVTNANETPTDIALSANTIVENSASGTTVGSFTSTDPDAANTFTYTLVAGAGSTDNAQFTIDGSGNLLSAAAFDFEATPTFSVRVRTTDQGGLFFEKAFTINVTNANETPTDVAISADTIVENLASGTTIGSFSSTDPDAGNTFTYTLVAGTGSTDNAQFTIDGSGNLKSAAPFDFEATPTLSVRVRSTDQGGLFFEKAFTINVTNANETPTDIALSANTIAENAPSGTTVGSFSSTDPDASNTFTYTLVAGTGSTDNALFTIDGSGTLLSADSFNFETTPTFSVRVRTTDQGGLFFEKIFTLNTTNANETPTDVALSANTIAENLASGTTVGSFSSTDPDAGNTFSYTLVAGAGSTDNAQFTIDGSGNLLSAAAFDFETTPTFSVRVRTTDQGGLFFEKAFTINVTNANETPTDVAISANTIVEGAASGTTVGSFSSTDPDAGNTFTYTLVAGAGGTDNAQFTIDGSGNLKSAAAFDFEATPTLSVRVRSTDQGGLFFEKIFTINVTNANETPTDVALSANTIVEGAASGTTVGSFNSTDPDAGNTFTYTLVGGAGSTDNAQFTIDGSGNLLSAAAFDFEATPTFSVRVRSTDQGGLFFEKAFTINVTNANETPTDVALSANTIVEGAASGTTVGSFSSTDPDAGNTFTYTLVGGAGSTDNAQFTIDGSGNLKSAAAFDFETTPTLSVRVRSTDQGGLFFEKIFTINVTNANETPTDIALSASTIAENSPATTTVGSFSSTDPDVGNTFIYTLVSGAGSTDNGFFTIDGSGALKTGALFDFESTPSFSIRVRTTDQGGLFVEKAFTISVVNINETPTDVLLSANTVAENAASGTTVGSFSSADPDAANTFTYTLVGGTGSTDNAQFTIDGSGNLKTAAAFNFETTPTLSVRVRSTDQGGLFFEKIFTINVTNANETPTDIAISASTVGENLASGTTVGSFSSTDPDAGNTFTYTLVPGTGSTDNALFTIDGSGNLKTAAAFNFETTPSLSVRVRSTDQGGLFFEKVFTITVTNVLEMVGNVVIGTGAAQRSFVNQLVLTFDGIITLDAGAFVVTKRGVGGGPVTTSVATSTSGGQTIVTLTFSGAFTRGTGNALLDGYYDLTADGSKIHSGSQTVDFNGDGVGGDTYVLGAAEADNFFALYGDTNGDGLVGVAEFGQFRNGFGKTNAQPGYDALFDYERDNSIGVSDFGQFRTRFGRPKLAFS